MMYRWTITPGDIYGDNSEVTISCGYKVVDFRPPKSNEKYIGTDRLMKVCAYDESPQYPRYILEKIKPLPKFLITVLENAPRNLNDGEYGILGYENIEDINVYHQRINNYDKNLRYNTPSYPVKVERVPDE